MTDNREAWFQQDIIDAMPAGGSKTVSASGYNHLKALYTDDMLVYVQEAQPKRWAKFFKANHQAPEQVLAQKIVHELMSTSCTTPTSSPTLSSATRH